MNDIFRQRRDRLVNGLNAIPNVSCTLPEGAFHAFPNITEITYDDRAGRSCPVRGRRRVACGGGSSRSARPARGHSALLLRSPRSKTSTGRSTPSPRRSQSSRGKRLVRLTDPPVAVILEGALMRRYSNHQRVTNDWRARDTMNVEHFDHLRRASRANVRAGRR